MSKFPFVFNRENIVSNWEYTLRVMEHLAKNVANFMTESSVFVVNTR